MAFHKKAITTDGKMIFQNKFGESKHRRHRICLFHPYFRLFAQYIYSIVWFAEMKKKTFHCSSSVVAASCWCVDFFFSEKNISLHLDAFSLVVTVRLLVCAWLHFTAEKVEKHSVWIRFDLIPRFSGDTKRKKNDTNTRKNVLTNIRWYLLQAEAKQQHRLNTLETSENTADDLF